MALASPTRVGREVGDPVVVKIAIGGRDLLAYAIVLRLAHSVAEMHLVAVAQQMDPRVREGQVMRAGDVPFIPMNVRGADMFRNMRTACQVTGLDADDNLTAAPDVDVQAALTAFVAALESGFISASGSDPDGQMALTNVASASAPADMCVQSQPMGSGTSSAAFVKIATPVRPPAEQR